MVNSTLLFLKVQLDLLGIEIINNKEKTTIRESSVLSYNKSIYKYINMYIVQALCYCSLLCINEECKCYMCYNMFYVLCGCYC